MLLKLLSLILLSVASIHLANAAALQFDSDDVVNLPLGQTAYPLTGFTWECWAQFSTQNSNICISALDTAWSQDFYLGTTVSNGQKIFFFSVPDDTFNGPVRSVRFIPPGGVVNNRWYHLCGVADYPGNTIKLYIDGELVDSAAWNLTPMSRYMPVAIGKNPGEPGITSFVGKISDVHFWNYPRSSAEIVSGMNTSVTGSETGLIAAYNCDEGSGQIVNDLTANARHGTLGSSNAVESNDPVWSIETRPAYSLLVSPSAFQFNYNVSRPTIAPQTFSVSKSGSGPLNYTISADQPWLTVSPNSGTLSNSSQNIQLTVSPAGLPEGVYSSTVTISASGAISRTVGVTLNVTDPLCVTALSFVPGSTTTSPPANITVSFNRNVNPATVNSSTLRLLRPGPDSVFGTSDDVAVVPDALTVTGSTVDLELSSTQLPNDSYRLILGTEPVALPDLKAHWRLDDPGSTLVDSSGKGNTATATGTLQTPGKYGMARACNGSSAASEFIDLNSQAELNFAAGAPFTICGWIKTTDGFGSIVSFRHSGNDFPVIDINVGYSGAFTSAGRLITLIRDDGGSTGFAQAVGGLVNDGNWHHFAVTRNSGNSISLYLDGAFQQSASGARSGGSITTNLRSLGLERRWMLTGHSTDDNRFINGSIDDVRVYGSQLYLVEIQKLASLSTIADANGNLLDGEINIDFPSGNGAPGGDFIANFILTQPQQSINFPILQDQVYGASPITLAATASSGLPVSYSATGPVVLAGNTLTIIGAGNVTVTASQEGNESFAPAPTVQRSFSVAPASLTIFAADKSKLYGDALPILTAVYSGFVNGDAATDLDVPPTLSTIADETSSVGNYQIIASSASDANYTISFINGTLSIIPASLVIIADNKFKIFGQSNPTFTATYIGFVNGDSVGSLNTPATITTSAGVNSNAGTYAIVVSDASDPNYDVHFVSGVLEVTAASQLITFTSLANRTFGDAPFTLSATGGASGNPVTFAATGPATITENTVTITGVGLVTVRASQAGNGNYLAAPDVDQSFIVNPAAQTINFGVLADKTFGEAAFDVSATGGASGNPVTFAVSGPATVVGSTVTITGAGLVTVTASQAGNANYLAAADVSRAFNVAKAAQTISFGVLADKTFGEAAFDVSATGGASGNPVTFAVSGPATIVGSTVTITGAGLVTVMASQAGSANYLAAADVSRAFNVAKATQTISFGVLADKTFGEAAFDVSATGGASGNPVTFAVSGPATLVGSTVTITGAGVVTVTASQAGNANYLAAADVSRAFVVAKAAQTISFGVLADKTFGDAAFDVSATGGASGNPVTFAVSGPATIVGSTVTITGAGLVTVMASQAGSANYLAAADVSRSFAVAKATPVITWANPNDILSGTALSAAQLNASASVAGVFSYSPTFGTVPARGSNQPLNVSFTPSDFVNYNAGAASVSINVLNADPTLSSVSATPNPATTGSAVAFSAAASDIDADSLIYTWDFAEGSKASGPNASHTYSVPGTYAVVLSVSDGQGGTVSSTIPLVVSAPASAPGALDSDGDGFTDAIEAASGSSASSAIETPLGGAKSTNPLPLADAKLKIKLNFSKPGTSDAITLAGTLLLPDGFKLPGSKLLVDVGGVAKSFTLGATGSVKVGNDLAAVKSKGTSARTAKFVVKLSKGNFASTLAPMGLTSADANSTSVNVPLMIILGDVTFVKIHPQIYSAKTGKTGATKDRK